MDKATTKSLRSKRFVSAMTVVAAMWSLLLVTVVAVAMAAPEHLGTALGAMGMALVPMAGLAAKVSHDTNKHDATVRVAEVKATTTAAELEARP